MKRCSNLLGNANLNHNETLYRATRVGDIYDIYTLQNIYIYVYLDTTNK